MYHLLCDVVRVYQLLLFLPYVFTLSNVSSKTNDDCFLTFKAQLKHIVVYCMYDVVHIFILSSYQYTFQDSKMASAGQLPLHDPPASPGEIDLLINQLQDPLLSRIHHSCAVDGQLPNLMPTCSHTSIIVMS